MNLSDAQNVSRNQKMTRTNSSDVQTAWTRMMLSENQNVSSEHRANTQLQQNIVQAQNCEKKMNHKSQTNLQTPNIQTRNMDGIKMVIIVARM